MHIVLVQDVHKNYRVKYQAQNRIKATTGNVAERAYGDDTPEGYMKEIYNTVYYSPYGTEQKTKFCAKLR